MIGRELTDARALVPYQRPASNIPPDGSKPSGFGDTERELGDDFCIMSMSWRSISIKGPFDGSDQSPLLGMVAEREPPASRGEPGMSSPLAYCGKWVSMICSIRDNRALKSSALPG